MAKKDCYTVRAQYWYNRNMMPLSVLLIGKRMTNGEWCYLSCHGDDAPEWIPAKRFTDFEGDPQKLYTYPRLSDRGKPRRLEPGRKPHHWPYHINKGQG